MGLGRKISHQNWQKDQGMAKERVLIRTWTWKMIDLRLFIVYWLSLFTRLPMVIIEGRGGLMPQPSLQQRPWVYCPRCWTPVNTCSRVLACQNNNGENTLRAASITNKHLVYPLKERTLITWNMYISLRFLCRVQWVSHSANMFTGEEYFQHHSNEIAVELSKTIYEVYDTVILV